MAGGYNWVTNITTSMHLFTAEGRADELLLVDVDGRIDGACQGYKNNISTCVDVITLNCMKLTCR